MTQEELAEKAGMSNRQISMYENASPSAPTNPQLSTVDKLARALDIAPRYLLDEDLASTCAWMQPDSPLETTTPGEGCDCCERRPPEQAGDDAIPGPCGAKRRPGIPHFKENPSKVVDHAALYMDRFPADQQQYLLSILRLAGEYLQQRSSDIQSYVQYRITRGVFAIPGEPDTYTGYGVEAYCNTSSGVLTLERIEDLSTQREWVDGLVRLLNTHQISPLHLRDVAEDFLSVY